MWYLQQLGSALVFLAVIYTAYYLFFVLPDKRKKAEEEHERLWRLDQERSHGTARWATYDEIMGRPEASMKTEFQDKKGRIYCGSVQRPGKEWNDPDGTMAVNWHTDQHVTMVAGAGSGKTSTIVIPNLILYPGPAVVLDPKGEIARVVGRCRERYGKVHYLDPWGVTGKPMGRFNPLTRLTAENVASESARLASALVVETGQEKDRHWIQGAQQLLTGLIAHVVTHDAYRAKADLPLVRRLLMTGMPAVLEEMKENPEESGIVANTGSWMLNLDEKERSSMHSTAVVETRFLDDPRMKASLGATGQGTTCDISQLHASTEGCETIFLSIPAPQLRDFNRWLRLIVTAALDELTARPRNLSHPVWFMLDELAMLGHFDAIEKAIGLARGYSVQVWSIFQDLGQMEELYGKRAESFMGNAGVKMFFGINDHKTAEYVSHLCGTTTIATRTTSANVQGNSESFGYAGRSLRTPDEIRRMEGNETLVFLSGLPPLITWRLRYDQIGQFSGYCDNPHAS